MKNVYLAVNFLGVGISTRFSVRIVLVGQGTSSLICLWSPKTLNFGYASQRNQETNSFTVMLVSEIKSIIYSDFVGEK